MRSPSGVSVAKHLDDGIGYLRRHRELVEIIQTVVVLLDGVNRA